MTPRDEVALRFPATPEFVPLARLAAIGAAGQAGLTGAESDALNAAVTRACEDLVAAPPAGGRIELHYRIRDGLVEVDGRVDTDGDRFRVTQRHGHR